MANSFTLSRKPFVKCYCFRESNDCQIARLALVCGRPNWKKPYNKHLISFVFSVRTVNYGCSFFPSIYGPGAYKSMKKKKNSVRNLQYGPKTRLIRGIYRDNSFLLQHMSLCTSLVNSTPIATMHLL